MHEVHLCHFPTLYVATFMLSGINSVPFFEFYLRDKPEVKQSFSGAQQMDTMVTVCSRLKSLAKMWRLVFDVVSKVCTIIIYSMYFHCHFHLWFKLTEVLKLLMSFQCWLQINKESCTGTRVMQPCALTWLLDTVSCCWSCLWFQNLIQGNFSRVINFHVGLHRKGLHHCIISVIIYVQLWRWCLSKAFYSLLGWFFLLTFCEAGVPLDWTNCSEWMKLTGPDPSPKS